MPEQPRTKDSTRKIAAGAVAGLLVLVVRAFVEGEPPDWGALEAYLTVVVFAFVLPATLPRRKVKEAEELEGESETLPSPTDDPEA